MNENIDIEFSHEPVMLDECIEALNIRPDGVYADCTAGGGGHSEAIIKRLTEGGRLIAVDRDEAAIEAVRKRLSPYSERLNLVRSNFSEASDIFSDVRLDGAMMDLGVSSYQLDNGERGFSYMIDAPLDMRMNRDEPINAYDIVNGYTHAQLTEIIYKWGEERFAPRIASAIVNAREVKPVKTTLELAGLIKGAVPAKNRETGHHPAKRTFQAIRIEVNHELDAIEPAVRAIVDRLNDGGRIAVITFHSLEDRIVKQTFAALAKGCVCPPDFPVCVCGVKPKLRIINRKPTLPSDSELERNPRSRSAKLRIAEKIG